VFINEYQTSIFDITKPVHYVTDIEIRLFPGCLFGTSEEQSLISVPMAMRKHLFSFRTQKLSSSAAIILPQVGN
jgi:hypothetical protein